MMTHEEDMNPAGVIRDLHWQSASLTRIKYNRHLLQQQAVRDVVTLVMSRPYRKRRYCLLQPSATDPVGGRPGLGS